MNSQDQNIKLFHKFPPSNKEAWVAESLKMLKNQDFSSLYTSTYEGISLAPFFTPDDQTTLPNIPLATEHWLNTIEIKVSDETSANHLALEALQQGANSLMMILLKNPPLDFAKLLQGIDLHKTPIHFRFFSQNIEAAGLLASIKFRGGIEFDFLANWLVQGDLDTHIWKKLHELCQIFKDQTVRTVFIQAENYHLAGAHVVQELALCLAASVEYIDYLEQNGIQLSDIFSKMGFSMPVGGDYFIEIAKFRAFRLLWAQLTEAYQIKEASSWLHARTSPRTKFAPDEHTNLLRATTEALAAVVGGCNSLTVGAYNEVTQEENEFSRRIARNVSIILQCEAHLDKVYDPAQGSYYIEYLTKTLAEESWKLFQEIEQRGGFIKAVEQGFVQDKIEETASLRKAHFDSGKDVFVGVNKFLKPADKTVTTSPDKEGKKDLNLLKLRRF